MPGTLLPPLDFKPLDPAQRELLLDLVDSLLCARPVSRDGVLHYIHSLCASELGGRVEVDIYLKGETSPVAAKALAPLTTDMDSTVRHRNVGIEDTGTPGAIEENSAGEVKAKL